MALTPDDIEAVKAVVGEYISAMKTVRVPELPPYSITSDPLTLLDRLPIWRNDTDKTVRTDLAALKAFILTGSSQVLNPDNLGESIVITINASMADVNRLDLPALENKIFVLRRSGYGTMKLHDQYDILSSGGFILTRPGDLLLEGEQYELQLVIDDANPSTPPTNVGNGSVLFNEAVSISSNLQLNATNHLQKLIQLRANSNVIKVTLPSIEDVPANTIIPMEAMLNCGYEVTIDTYGGQYIYFNGESKLKIYIRQGEYIWFYRGSDGWYVLLFSESIREAGKLDMDLFINTDTELECNGVLQARSLNQRAWEAISTRGYAIVDDATWNIPAAYFYNSAWTLTQPPAGSTYTTVPNPYRGCFSSGDGTTTFRTPDFRNAGVRMLGADNTQRFYNHPGGFQLNELKEHNHGLGFNRAPQSGSATLCLTGFGSQVTGNTSATGGVETRMDNIGIIFKIKK